MARGSKKASSSRASHEKKAAQNSTLLLSDDEGGGHASAPNSGAHVLDRGKKVRKQSGTADLSESESNGKRAPAKDITPTFDCDVGGEAAKKIGKASSFKVKSAKPRPAQKRMTLSSESDDVYGTCGSVRTRADVSAGMSPQSDVYVRPVRESSTHASASSAERLRATKKGRAKNESTTDLQRVVSASCKTAHAELSDKKVRRSTRIAVTSEEDAGSSRTDRSLPKTRGRDLARSDVSKKAPLGVSPQRTFDHKEELIVVIGNTSAEEQHAMVSSDDDDDALLLGTVYTFSRPSLPAAPATPERMATKPLLSSRDAIASALRDIAGADSPSKSLSAVFSNREFFDVSADVAALACQSSSQAEGAEDAHEMAILCAPDDKGVAFPQKRGYSGTFESAVRKACETVGLRVSRGRETAVVVDGALRDACLRVFKKRDSVCECLCNALCAVFSQKDMAQNSQAVAHRLMEAIVALGGFCALQDRASTAPEGALPAVVAVYASSQLDIASVEDMRSSFNTLVLLSLDRAFCTRRVFPEGSRHMPYTLGLGSVPAPGISTGADALAAAFATVFQWLDAERVSELVPAWLLDTHRDAVINDHSERLPRLLAVWAAAGTASGHAAVAAVATALLCEQLETGAASMLPNMSHANVLVETARAWANEVTRSGGARRLDAARTAALARDMRLMHHLAVASLTSDPCHDALAISVASSVAAMLRSLPVTQTPALIAARESLVRVETHVRLRAALCASGRSSLLYALTRTA